MTWAADVLSGVQTGVSSADAPGTRCADPRAADQHAQVEVPVGARGDADQQTRAVACQPDGLVARLSADGLTPPAGLAPDSGEATGGALGAVELLLGLGLGGSGSCCTTRALVGGAALLIPC